MAFLPPSARVLHTAPRYESLGDRLSDVASTLGGVLGLAQGVTDNASVNVVPLPVRRSCVCGFGACLPMCCGAANAWLVACSSVAQRKH